MSNKAFELVVITPEMDFPKETRWLNKLFAEGLGTLHLRKPGRSSQELLQYLNELDEQYHDRIMVHYKEEVWKDIGIKGIHYQYSALPKEKPGYAVSCGCHSWREFMEIEKRVDYAFISPFFDSISKEGYRASKDLLEVPPELNTDKAVALGGIQPSNICQILKLKLKGAAVLGTIWESDDPIKAFRKMNFAVDKG